jgi:hypothetical protein
MNSLLYSTKGKEGEEGEGGVGQAAGVATHQRQKVFRSKNNSNHRRDRRTVDVQALVLQQ